MKKSIMHDVVEKVTAVHIHRISHYSEALTRKVGLSHESVLAHILQKKEKE